MYTGLIRALGRIREVLRKEAGCTVRVERPTDWQDLQLGESIALNGVCLTVAGLDAETFSVDVVAETLRKTTLGGLAALAQVNLERCLRHGDRIEGHWLSGHIDTAGTIQAIQREGDAWLVTIAIPKHVPRFWVDKGSIGIDGMSITVIKAQGDCFTVTLIPHTRAVTIAQYYQVGTQVNLEFDAFLKKKQLDEVPAVAWKSVARLPTQEGVWQCHVFSDADEQVALMVLATASQPAVPLVRVHSACMTSEVLGSQRCDCKEQLDQAKAQIAKEGGYVIYLPQEGRGIGLVNKIRAYALQDQGLNTIEANLKLGFAVDQRQYAWVREVLQHFKVERIRLLTNNPAKQAALEQLGITVVKREPIVVSPRAENQEYLRVKGREMGHMF